MGVAEPDRKMDESQVSMGDKERDSGVLCTHAFKADGCAVDHARMGGNGPETTSAGRTEDRTASSPVPSSVETATTSANKRKRSEDAQPDGDDADMFSRQFSRAQVDVKVKRARLEANIAVQEEIKTLRLELLKAQQNAQDEERQREQAEVRYATLQESMQDIVKMHQRTLLGMRDNIKLENLVASLEKEKASKEALKLNFQQQNAELLRVQQRLEELKQQIVKYQKTETALAQSVTHFQHQFASKDHEKAATIERMKQHLEEQHHETRVALENEVDRLVADRDGLQRELQALRVEFTALQETALSVAEQQEKREEEESHLRGRVEQLEREKAVLNSKVEQVQKADTQLRSKIQEMEQQIVTLKHENEELRADNVELGKIATDLMDMAENQHKEKEQILQIPDEEGHEKLTRTRTRLRESLG